MLQTPRLRKSNLTFLIVGLAWIMVWVIPWGKLPMVQGNLYLAFVTEMIRLGIAIVIFIFPGALLYVLLKQDDDQFFDLRGIIPIGFTFSVLLSSVIGLTGRIAGFSFEFVKSAFALTGLIELTVLAFYKPCFALDKKRFTDSIRSVFKNPPLFLALILTALMTFNGYLFFIDDLSYLAYLTNWQYSLHLGFGNIVHSASVIENVRYWIAMYPMGQALLADLSGVPGILLLGNYLELFLVQIAVVASYWFARNLGLSRRAAGFSVLIQISLYTWMTGWHFPVGMWFYQSMAEDKVTGVFILSPVFFAFVLRFLRSSTKINLILVFLSSLSLTFSHPVILFFSCLVASGFVLFSWMVRNTSWRAILQLFIVFFASMGPYVAIRFSDIPIKMSMPFDSKAVSTTYQIERYLNVTTDVLYGLNPDVLKFIDIPPETNGYTAFQFFRLVPVILMACAGVLAFFNLRKGVFYWYIFTCVLLIFFATLQYTGWILGYFVTARVIPRVSWYAPLGLSGVLILKLVKDWLKSCHIIEVTGRIIFLKRLRVTIELIGISGCLAFAAPVLASSLVFQSSPYFEKLDHNRQLAQIGVYIDKNTSYPVTSIALDYWDTQLLPGVSAHTVLISFREETEYNGFNNFLSLDEIHARIYASNAIRLFDNTISPEERCFFIKQFNVKFVLARRDNTVGLFTGIVNECGIAVENVFETEDLILLEIKYGIAVP